MSEIKPVYQVCTVPHGWKDIPQAKYQDALNNLELDGRILYYASDYEAQAHRANALALVINDLSKIVTHDGETKQQFIERVKAILSVDPDLRVSELQVAYEALKAENEALQKENEALIQKLETAAFNHFAAQERIEAQAKRIANLEELLDYYKNMVGA